MHAHIRYGLLYRGGGDNLYFTPVLKKDGKRTRTPLRTSVGAPAVTRGYTPMCENSLQRTDKHFNIGHMDFFGDNLKNCLQIPYHHKISR